MTVSELIALVKSRPEPTRTQWDSFIARIEAKEAEYGEYAERTKVTAEMLNRVYTL